MRSDMAKVLCEKERRGARFKYPKGEKRRWDNIPDDEKPYKETGGVRRKWIEHWHDGKQFSENLGPLRGYILSCVGRNWDDVYSEVCRYIDKGNIVQNHILTHLYQYLARNVVIKDDVVYDNEYPFTPIRELAYVHPETKIICRNKNPRRKYSRAKQEKIVSYPASPDSFYLQDNDGIWWECFVKPMPEPVKTPADFSITRDAAANWPSWFGMRYHPYNMKYDQYLRRKVRHSDTYNLYGPGNFYCYKKLQLSKADIKKVKRKYENG